MLILKLSTKVTNSKVKKIYSKNKNFLIEKSQFYLFFNLYEHIRFERSYCSMILKQTSTRTSEQTGGLIILIIESIKPLSNTAI